MKTKIFYWIIFAIIVSMVSSCEMDERPYTTTDKKAIFSSEEGLKAYSMSFYNLLPDATNQIGRASCRERV